MLPGASVTVRVRRPAAGRVTGTNRLRRPRRGDQGAAGGRLAMIGSASQCPPAAPSSPLGRAQTGGWRPGIRLLAPGLGLLRPAGSGGVRRVRPVRRALIAPATGRAGRRRPGRTRAPGWICSRTGAHALIIGVLEPQAGGDPPGDRPRSPGRVDDPLAPGRVGARPRGSWGGPRAPGPRPAPPRGGRPRPTPAPRRISPDTVGRHRPHPAGDEGGPSPPAPGPRVIMARASGPQAQAPTGAPATPARRVPGDPMAARRPRAALGAEPHRHARTRRRQRGGRRYSYTYRATTCPRS